MRRHISQFLSYLWLGSLSSLLPYNLAFVSNSRQGHYLQSQKNFLKKSFHTIIHAYNEDNDDFYSVDFQPESNGRTCVKHFLTQRSVQSFMFLLEQCRDPHTVNWMEKFSDTPNLLKYHGTGAFNMTRFESWDSILMEMVERKRETVVIEARRRGAGTGGWSKNNPYLKPRFVEFNIDIDPPSLASRILSVREQIAKEWLEDLDLVIQSGDLILDSYFDNVANERDNEEFSENETDEMFEDYREKRDKTPKSKKNSPVFERTATLMVNNLNPYGEMKSSPFRKGSFDLLHLLATQESIHWVLHNLKNMGPEEEPSYLWLRAFYCDRIPDFFDGNQKYGRYDDFIEELLQSTPTVKNNGNGKVSIVDPVGLTEKIIRMRGAVAQEWKEVMANTPQDHIDLRRNLLTRQMQVSEPENSNILGEFE